MPRRGDNIRKRKDGRWEARYVTDDNEGLSKKYASVYGKSYQEAREKREQIIKHSKEEVRYSKDLYFRDVLKSWQDSNRVRLKDSSVSRYQNLIDTHILPELGNRRMSQINASVINRFLTAKLKTGRLDKTGGLSASYVRSITLIISSAINYGVSEKMCKPLCSHITKPTVTRKELTVLSESEQSRLENELLDNMNEEKLLIFITLYTGLRIGEICALRWEDISLESNLLYVRKTVSRVWYIENGRKRSRLIVDLPKTKSSYRCIPICSKLSSVISAFLFRHRTGYMLSGVNDTDFVSPRTFEYRYKKIMKKANVRLVNYHALRHTFATRCIERGVDIKTLSEILGHADASITLNTYVHSSVDLKRIQLEKIAS